MARRKNADILDILKLFIGIGAVIGIALVFTFRIVTSAIKRISSYLKEKKTHSSHSPHKGLPATVHEIKTHTSYGASLNEYIGLLGNSFLDHARSAEKAGDYLGARVEYMKCIEDLKRSGAPEDQIQYATREYEEFVKRDPIFEKLVSSLLPIIEVNPGMLQSQISKRFLSMEWPYLYNYDRPVAKEDIYYALYFAEKRGLIRRNKKGRSYELYIEGKGEEG
jgi:hypothetical protein